jgi:formylglycine-generating enzyme required for sulfatase activity
LRVSISFFLFFLIFRLPFTATSQSAVSKYIDTLIPGTAIPLKLVAIPGGSFLMGDNSSANASEKPATTVAVSPFYMSVYEITHDQFGVFFRDEKFAQGSKVDAVTRPTAQYIDLSWNMGKEGGFPVNSMSVDAAMMFCRWLYQKTGVFYRLPTEAEWEYACRAGTKTAYYFGNDNKLLGQYAWFKGNSSEKYHKVGQKKPNAWGLYDMLGNVSEWTLDQYDEKYFSTIAADKSDPVIPPASRYPRSVRGGSYVDQPQALRSAARQHSEPAWNKRDPQVPKSRWWLTDGAFVGFRIVRPLDQPNKAEAENFYKLYLGK